MTLLRRSALVILGVLSAPAALAAQATGTVRGTVTRTEDKSPLPEVMVMVKGTGIQGSTANNGQYTLSRVPPGQQTILFRWLGYKPVEASVNVPPGGAVNADAAMESQPISLGEVVVSAASRSPERQVEAPAAITMIDTRLLKTVSLTGQAPLAVANVPGVDVVQSGVNDMNVNARGFNSSLNRRMLVLQDGRDLAVALLG